MLNFNVSINVFEEIYGQMRVQIDLFDNRKNNRIGQGENDDIETIPYIDNFYINE